MHEEGVEVSGGGKPGENGEPSNRGVQETTDLTVSQKYRGLRSRLKYLIYVSVGLCVGAGRSYCVFFSSP
jgi:hypothetical protein